MAEENSELMENLITKQCEVAETKKSEVAKVKLEPVEAEDESFGGDLYTWELANKADNHENTDMIVPDRIKDENDFAKVWIQCNVSNEETPKIEACKMKVEEDLDTEKYDNSGVSEGIFIKSENDCDVMDANGEIISNSSVNLRCSMDQHQLVGEEATKGTFRCYNCNYAACNKNQLITHMKQHKEQNSAYLHSSSHKLNICIHCSGSFSGKKGLDDHIIRKHPEFISSISRKIHECPCCTYKTTRQNDLARHKLKHPGIASSYKLKKCTHCNATFRSKSSLNHHTIREHPDFISHISSRILECTHCTFKTTLKHALARHMLKHPETTSTYKLVPCNHCGAKFRQKPTLDDHIIRKHPDFISSISSKVHECTLCSFKTTVKTHFTKHMMHHLNITSDFKLSTCAHCNATFRSKMALNDHTVRKHPDYIACVSSKIHECSYCSYKTVKKATLDRHLLKHPEIASSIKLRPCIHCNSAFKSKQHLDNHIITKHPDFIPSVSSKIHECKFCSFKTTLKGALTEHMYKHPQMADSHKFINCMHCDMKFQRKRSLNNHTLRKHPDFISTVSSKIHECPQCTYKTTMRGDIDKHMSTHSEMYSKPKFKVSPSEYIVIQYSKNEVS